jgi:gliding motility-associated-like protein
MKKLIFTALTTLILAFIATNTAHATHVAAGDITTRQIDSLNPNKFEVTIRFYRDCGPNTAGAPTTVPIDVQSPCFGPVNFPAFPRFLEDTINGNGGGAVKGSNCILDDIKPCTAEWLYRDTIELPGPCDFWTISWDVFARPGNDNHSSQDGFYVENNFSNKQLYNNTGNPISYFNNSPVFNNDEPVSSFCIGREYEFDLSATDPDGDSLAYFITPSLSGFGTQVAYAAGFTGNDPLPVVKRPVKVDVQTGVMKFTPAAIFKGSFAYIVEEWKDSLWTDTLPNNSIVTKSKKVYRGSIMRDLRIVFGEICNDEYPVFTNTSRDSSNYPTGYTGNNPNLIVMDCAAMYFDIELDVDILCSTVEINGSDLRVTDSTTTPPTIYAIDSIYPIDGCKALKTKKLRVKLFQPIGLPSNHVIGEPGGIIKAYIKRGSDFNTWKTACGINIPEFTVFDIYVNNNLEIDMGEDIIYCNPENPFPIINAPIKGGIYQWFYKGSLNGTEDTLGTEYTQMADTTGYWGVNLKYSGCQAKDFLFVQENKTIFVEIPDYEFCNINPYPVIRMDSLIPLGVDVNTFTWKGPKGDIIGISDSLEIPASGKYIFKVDILPCTINDTFNIKRIDEYPVNLGNDSLICEGYEYTLTSGYDYDTSKFQIEWYFNDSLLVNDTIDEIMVNKGGEYKFRLISPSGCEGLDSVNVRIAGYLGIPELACGQATREGKLYIWKSIPSASYYEYSFDQVNWLPLPTLPSPSPLLGDISARIPGLGSPTAYIRAVSDVPEGTVGGCKYGASATAPDCEIIVIMPNVLTPNGDGINDYLDLGLIDIYPGNSISIYNRWGREVFQATDYQNDWNASDVEAGTYFYVLDLNDNEQPIQKGTLTIIK